MAADLAMSAQWLSTTDQSKLMNATPLDKENWAENAQPSGPHQLMDKQKKDSRPLVTRALGTHKHRVGQQQRNKTRKWVAATDLSTGQGLAPSGEEFALDRRSGEGLAPSGEGLALDMEEIRNEMQNGFDEKVFSTPDAVTQLCKGAV